MRTGRFALKRNFWERKQFRLYTLTPSVSKCRSSALLLIWRFERRILRCTGDPRGPVPEADPGPPRGRGRAGDRGRAGALRLRRGALDRAAAPLAGLRLARGPAPPAVATTLAEPRYTSARSMAEFQDARPQDYTEIAREAKKRRKKHAT